MATIDFLVTMENTKDGTYSGVSVMDHSNFLGGICKRGMAPTSTGEEWGWLGATHELFVRGAVGCQLFKWDSVALLVRGYARSSEGPLDQNRVARYLHEEYCRTGELAVQGLDGAFTLALLDSRAERVLLYRNLIGTGFTYYQASAQGLLFAGNLTELLPHLPSPRPNREVLPSFFLYRCVPGRETMFEGVERLLPGEQLCWEAGQLQRTQRQTFASFKGAAIPAKEALERTDATMTAILHDMESHRPGLVNLLSGGVDSSYIQAIYNQEIYKDENLPMSYCIAVDHPMTWIDTDYAITASMAIGTQHRLAPADGPYIGYLTETLQATAEPLNHVQSAYFGTLARQMAEDGVRAGLCGEGADSLFGVGLANKLQNAAVVEKVLPIPPLRRLAAGAAGLLGWDSLRRTLDRAGKRYDETDPDHPINQVACFTDRKIALRCFGEQAIRDAEAKRRALLDQYEVGSDPLDRLHATGFLGEAMDSAGLWATLFQRAGVDLLCPFLDSRMIRLALNLPPHLRYTFRRPKALLKAALAQRVTPEIAYRVKLGFGQPIFEWLRTGGQLSGPVSRIRGHGFLAPGAVGGPNWFSYSALCYDVWHRTFIDASYSSESASMENMATA
jgi:asparagine synthase (glutamine-hydrolysing)